MNTKCGYLIFILESRIWTIKILANINPKYNLCIHMHMIYISQAFILKPSVVMSVIYFKISLG